MQLQTTQLNIKKTEYIETITSWYKTTGMKEKEYASKDAEQAIEQVTNAKVMILQ